MKKVQNKLSQTKELLKSLYLMATKILFEKLPSTVGAPLAALLIVAPILLAIATYYLGSSKHPSSYTVMITDLEGFSGGSGVIVKNTPSESVVLTNNHVCEGALKKGGKIRLVSGEEHIVTGYMTDLEHDLCVLTVASDLKNSIKIASSAPSLYTQATVTGHPALMPNVITNGHFSGRQIVQVIVGVRKCKKSDLNNPQNAMFCAFFGVVPIIRNYESQIVTATIMPGSSGSAVLNSDGELAGIVFAGNSDGLSYAFIVPFEAVRNFLDNDARNLIEYNQKIRPWNEEPLEEESASQGDENMMSFKEAKSLIEDRCYTQLPKDIKVRDFCRKVAKDIRP